LGGTGQSGTSDLAFASLNVSFPIFDSGITRAKVKQAREDEKLNATNLEQTRLAVSQEVRAAYKNLQTARERLAAAEEQLRLANEVLRIAQIRSDAGEGTTLEIVDAQTQVTAAGNTVVQARFDYLTSYAELQRAAGQDSLTASPDPKATNQTTGDTPR
jgi:outer membrane protein TolC